MRQYYRLNTSVSGASVAIKQQNALSFCFCYPTLSVLGYDIFVVTYVGGLLLDQHLLALLGIYGLISDTI